MEKRYLNKLEFYKIQELLSDLCQSTMAKQLALDLLPQSTKDEILYILQETEEGKNISNILVEPNFSQLPNLENILKLLKASGSLTNSEEFMQVLQHLMLTHEMIDYFDETESTAYPLLHAMKEQLLPLYSVEKLLKKIFDQEGNVRDTASTELAHIRKKIRNYETQLRDRIEEMAQSSRYEAYLQDDVIVVRNGRYCLSVKSGYKNKIPGIVHDRSASGMTLYIEPQKIVTMYNDLLAQQELEQVEIKRIFKEISNTLSPHVEGLHLNQQMLTRFDFIFAKAKLSRAMHARSAQWREEGTFEFYQARHPLIDRSQAVPISAHLGTDFDALIITGPNTGGKTVALKTMGLLIAMHQSGLHIPVGEGSRIGLFKSIFVDIGDEQSIEQNLSTFSSHMSNIQHILKNVTENDLVLLDELGAGTDPEEGAALAISIIESLLTKNARIMATTHYASLKTFALKHERVENASVEFDVESLAPTYRLIIGKTGQSNAFAIASRIGLNPQIVQRAQVILDEQADEKDLLLKELGQKEKAAEVAQSYYETEREKVILLEKDLKEKIAKIDNEKESIIQGAKLKASNLLQDARMEADEMIRVLNKVQSAEALKSAKEQRNALVAKRRQFEPKQKQTQSAGKIPDLASLEVGTEVEVPKFNHTGIIEEKPKSEKKIAVQIGAMHLTLPLKDLRTVKQSKKTKQSAYIKNASKVSSFSPELDLRGAYSDEAVKKLDKYLDDAYLAGVNVVSIIHGKGTGALRKEVTKALKHHSQVKSYRLGNISEGGDGVTIVEIKR